MCIATTFGALGVTIVLLTPWSISVLAGRAPLDMIVGTRSWSVHRRGLGSAVRMATGPIGDTPLVWGLLVAAALPLFIGRRWRLTWAGRMWVCALAAWVVALCAERGWTGSLSALPAQFLPIAACGLALSTALGVTAFSLDLPASRFGWRQVVSALAGCAALVGALPAIAANGEVGSIFPRRDFPRFSPGCRRFRRPEARESFGSATERWSPDRRGRSQQDWVIRCTPEVSRICRRCGRAHRLPATFKWLRTYSWHPQEDRRARSTARCPLDPICRGRRSRCTRCAGPAAAPRGRAAAGLAHRP